ncbi:MAG: FAD-dependent thymidylate synthase [Candidatus Glassbacteria bacterium]
MEVTLLSITPDAEKLIERAGRTCYKSLPRIGTGTESKFIRMLVGSGHESVLEHAVATFRILGGSRAFTHQMVRHRLCSFSQQSQRYVDEKEFKHVEPPSIADNEQAHRIFVKAVDSARRAYARLQELGIKREDARYLLPNAVESEIVVSANFRELRHIFRLRCAKSAQWEIRRICIEMLRIMKKEAPSVFADFVVDDDRMVADIIREDQE